MSVPRFLRVAVAACLAFVPALAGCIDDTSSDLFVAEASSGHGFSSWDYAATSIQHMTAGLSIRLYESNNTGLVHAEGNAGPMAFHVQLTEFNHSATDFHSGGIAANFVEHGDSGVGNDLLPRMFLLAATWGPGGITINGNPFVDPYTGDGTMDAHLMVTNTGVREDATGRVLKSDGATPYDPATAGDAMVGTDNEAHLVLTSRFTEDVPAPASVDWAGAFPPGQLQATYPIEIAYGQAVLNITINLGSDPYEVGPYRFSLHDPDGNELEAVTLQQPGLATRMIDKAVNGAGTYMLRASAEGVPVGNWNANITTTYPPKPFFYFVWEDVTISERFA